LKKISNSSTVWDFSAETKHNKYLIKNPVENNRPQKERQGLQRKKRSAMFAVFNNLDLSV